MRRGRAVILMPIAVHLVGCGLVLDLDPVPATVDAGSATLDASVRVDAGFATDASTTSDAGADRDAADLVDAGWPEADAGPPCAETPCRLLPPQCGCHAGQACYPVAGEPTCLVEGTAGDGDVCGSTTYCAAALSCVVAAGDAYGTCRPYCAAPSDCAAGARCLAAVARPPGVGFCEQVCDPLTNTGCPTGLGCYVAGAMTADGMSVIAWSCNVPGTRVAGAACLAPNDCAPTLACGGGSCRALCRPGDTCDGGTTCTATITVGTVGIGLCP